MRFGGETSGARATLASLALIGLVAARAGAFSLPRALHNADRDVAEDASIYSQNRINDQEFKPSSSSQSKMMGTYVSIKTPPQERVTMARGHRVTLTCEVDASPPPRIYWIMGENPKRQVEQLERESVADVSYTAVAREVSKLIIDCVEPLDQNLIHCVGISADRMEFSTPTVLNVGGTNTSTPSICQGEDIAPVVTRFRPLIFSEMDSTVELPCEAIGNPQPHIHWVSSENKPLKDPRYVVQPSGSLLITNLSWQDMGGYKCVAESDVGSADATTFLYPAAKPTPKRDNNL